MTSTALKFTGDYTGDKREARSDLRGRAIVERGIALQHNSNTMAAFEYLRSRGVGTEVIARVLFDALRRGAGV